jgi:hypothetical protein
MPRWYAEYKPSKTQLPIRYYPISLPGRNTFSPAGVGKSHVVRVVPNFLLTFAEGNHVSRLTIAIRRLWLR